MLGIATLVSPLKLKAPLIFPVVHVPPLNCPVYPLPDESCAILPAPSSNPQYPISPCVGAAPLVPALLTTTITGLDVIVFPLVSLATAVNV
jgi:hypothetical protein